MRFKLKRPCKHCPFRNDIHGYLTPDRAASIAADIAHGNKTFACHETTAFDEDTGEYIPNRDEMHCAGALILLEKTGEPNAMVQIAERFGLYDPSGLDMSAPVCDTFEEFIATHDE